MTGPDDAHLRIGHAERDRAVEVLRDAAGDGRLTLDELDERIEAALSARTASDLAVILADLVPGGTLGAVVDPRSTLEPGLPGSSWDNPLVLTARWDDVKRAGAWEVPPFLEAHAVAGNVKLDFQDAIVTSKVVDISVHGGAGDIVIVVPQGFGVDVSHLHTGLGGVRSRVAPRPSAGQPQLVVRGTISMGDIKVRYPNRLDTWQRERRIARGNTQELKN